MPLEWLDRGISFRPGQAEAVRRIKDAFDRGVKTVFLDAPVGSGKSLINLLVARELRGAYISTPQVILVNQYGADTRQDGKFAGLAETLYGRRNYPCNPDSGRTANNYGRDPCGAPAPRVQWSCSDQGPVRSSPSSGLRPQGWRVANLPPPNDRACPRGVISRRYSSRISKDSPPTPTKMNGPHCNFSRARMPS